MNTLEAISLYELNEFIKRVIALNFPDALWVRAEIAQVSMARGHVFLDFVEKSEAGAEILARSEGVLWLGTYRQLSKIHGEMLENLLQEGLEVQVKVRVDYHERYGLKLVVEDVDPAFTMGQLELRKRETLLLLAQEGLRDRNRQLPLAPVLQRIAVLTSERAAGYQDFVHQLQANGFGYRFDLTLFPTAMQGSQVEAEMLAQLESIAASVRKFDAVVVIRGGGARLDLVAFDSLALARSIAHLPLPVFTGIGHEVDETVLDFVAHQSLKTPTAVADFLIHHNMAFEAGIGDLGEEIKRSVRSKLEQQRLVLQYAAQNVRFLAREQLRDRQRQLEQAARDLPQYSKMALRSAGARLDNMQQLFESLTPQATLNRGYSITQQNGRVIFDAAQADAGLPLETHLAHGSIISKIEKTTSA